MKRRMPATDGIPAELVRYDERRWVAEAGLDILAAHIPVAERSRHWYVRSVLAPIKYRQALVASVGHRTADAHLEQLRRRAGRRHDRLFV